MAFRNPNGPPGTVGFGMLPYHQQMYVPGNMNVSLPGQQLRPRPGSTQFMQQRPSFPGMTPQRFPVIPQGMAPQQGGFAPQMYAGQVPPQGVNMQQQMNFQQQQQQQQQQVFAGQTQPLPPHMQQPLTRHPSQQRPVAEVQKKSEEKAKKERYFQEQQWKLKQFGKVGGKAASVDSLHINLDEMFGKGVAGKEGGGKETGKERRKEARAAKSPAEEDDGFGDFLQGPTPPVDTPQTPEAGSLTPQGQQTLLDQPHLASQDEGFGDLMQGPRVDRKEEKKEVRSLDSTSARPLKEDTKVLSLESMMLDSTNLAAPSKPTKSFHHKKPLRELDSTSQAHRQQTFASTVKGRQWSSAENVSSLFTMPETPAQSGVGQADHGQGLKAGSPIVGSQAGGGKGLPAWCMNESSLPLVYRQVLEASLRDDQIDTNLLYPILMLSGLDKPVLGRIWGIANQMIPGQLTRMELYIVLGLIALAQSGQQPTIEALHHVTEAPLPILTPKGQPQLQMGQQSLAQSSHGPPATARKSAEDEDEFAPFQEALGISPRNASSTQQKDEHASFKSTIAAAPALGSKVTVTSNKHKHADDDIEHEKHGMDSSLKFPKEEENCYIFAGSPADSSSGRSSPLVWDPNSIYDKLTCRSQESVSTGSLSDRTPGEEDDDEDEFHDFKSAPKTTKTSAPSILASFPSIAPPKGHSSGAGASVSSAADKHSKFVMSGAHSFDSVHRKKGTLPSSEDQQKIDLFHMDFEKVFPKVGRKTMSTDDFGSFQAGSSVAGSVAAVKEDIEFGDFTHFKHSASESDLMGMQPAEGDKYAVLRDLAGDTSHIRATQTIENEDEFDDFKQAGPSQAATAAAPAVSLSDSFTDFKESTQPMSHFNAKFQDTFTSVPPAPPSSIFDGSQTLPTISLSPSLPDEKDDFADFKQAVSVPPTTESHHGDVFSLKSDSVSTSSSEDKYGVLRVLGNADDAGPQDDDFGDFQTNVHPPTMDSLSVGAFVNKSIDENVMGEMRKPVSASDLYGMEFDALGSINSGSVAMLNLEDATENEPSDVIDMTPTELQYSTAANSFHSLQTGELSKLESIDRLDLKTFDLDLSLGRSAEMEGKERADSFGEFSSASIDVTSPVENPDRDIQQDSTSGPVNPSYSVSTVPLVPSGSSLVADRYSEVVGNVDDENRHANEWQRCLEKCHGAVKKANNIFNNISSSSVCNEVIKSSEGAEYLTAVIEIYRVACRIVTSMNAMGVDSSDLQRLQKDIELVWNNLSAFLASSTLMPAPGSFVFKTAILRPEPTNTERACGVCLLNVDSRSKAFDRSKDSHKLAYGGRQYHASCANFWVNMVDSILPALPLNRLL